MLRQLSIFIAIIGTGAFLSLGHGALAALVLQQGAGLEFSETFLGVLTSVSYAGFFLGSFILRPLLLRVSYIRTYAVSAALIAVACLMLPIFPTEWGWFFLRFFHGVFFSVSVIICEGWLNSKADKSNRSRIFGSYMTVSYLCYGISQYILTVGAQTPHIAYSLAAICLVASLLPVCLTRFPEPKLSVAADSGGGLSVRDAYQIAPVAFIGQILVGVVVSSGWLFVHFAQKSGFDTADTAFLAALFFSSGFILQFPIGWLSDRSPDRRNIIIVVAIISAILAFFILLGAYLPFYILAILIFLFGSISATLFALNMAYGQDFVEQEKSTEYSGRLFMGYASGALVGPLIAGGVMELFSPTWLFGFMAIVLALLSGVTITNRFMPHFRLAKTAAFQALSPHSATQALVDADAVSSVADIGPDLPPQHTQTSAPQLADIGPDISPQHTQTSAPQLADIGPDISPQQMATTESKPAPQLADIGPDISPQQTATTESKPAPQLADIGPDISPQQTATTESKNE